MIYAILSKLVSESLLSLYPVFVKNIGLPLTLQSWSRFFSYTIISGCFIDYPFVINTMLSSSGIMLSLVTMIHIYTSYRGFELLESGVAYSLFYLYPIMILFIANRQFNPIILLALFGVFLLISNAKFDIMDIVKSPEGLIMILLAAFTEAIIYFLVRNIKTTNHWNHIFISYFFGAILFSSYFFKNIITMNLSGRLSLSLIINAIIGLFGYLLRFFAISRLETNLYASLSFFGIIMVFVYGVIFNGEMIEMKKLFGAILIIISNLMLL